MKGIVPVRLSAGVFVGTTSYEPDGADRVFKIDDVNHSITLDEAASRKLRDALNAALGDAPNPRSPHEMYWVTRCRAAEARNTAAMHTIEVKLP